MSYDDLSAPKRDDESFRKVRHPEHHQGTSPFCALEIDMVETFVCDYMHCILIGIVKKVIGLFLKRMPYKISNSMRKALDRKVSILSKFIPCDFNRKLRSFSEFDRFKATEFRTIIMYAGIFIFKGILKKHYYEHFLILMFIVRILCDKEQVADPAMLDYVQNLCSIFIERFKELYKNVAVSHNVHSLLHIVDDVRRLGVLDSFSAFPFENCMGSLRSRIRSTKNPLSQIGRRISEGFSLGVKIPRTNDSGYINGRRIEPGRLKDSCIMTINSVIGIVEEINSVVYLRKLIKLCPLATYPDNSGILGMYYVKKSEEIIVIDRNDIEKKCFICPYKNKFIVMPLL